MRGTTAMRLDPPQAFASNRRMPATRDPAAVSEGWEMPSITGTSGKSKGLTPSMQATFTPNSIGLERRR